MNLQYFIDQKILYSLSHAFNNIEVSGISFDSRLVRKGDIFIAIPGTQEDGVRYVPQALEKGASAIVISKGTEENLYTSWRSQYPEVRIFSAKNVRLALSILASHYFPSQPETIVAVTGTNGKSSTVSFMRQIWTFLGYKAASLGTLGLIRGDQQEVLNPANASLTSADPLTLHKQMDTLAQEQYTHLALEASSHGLHQYRLDGLRLKAGVFTNLSNDHLDYHPTLDEYLNAKMRLFSELLPENANAVLNADIQQVQILRREALQRSLKILTFGFNGEFVKIIESTPTDQGQEVSLLIDGLVFKGMFPLAGKFQLGNAVAALCAVIGCGGSVKDAFESFQGLKGVIGRLERVSSQIYVDYAHTPHALESALKSLRPHVRGRLILVFGCGGNRDAFKRPLMGAIAHKLADKVILTDDNPRHEDPAAIRQQILKACPGAFEIANRREAIHLAVDALAPGDILLIAGKGHEMYQIVGNETFHFSDQEEVRKYIGA